MVNHRYEKCNGRNLESHTRDVISSVYFDIILLGLSSNLKNILVTKM